MALITLPDGSQFDDSMFAANAPTALDFAGWGNQRRTATTAFGNQSAQYNFDRGQTLAQQSTDTQQLAQRYSRMREGIPGQFAGRGLLNSGIYGTALTRYGEDQANSFGNLTQQYQQRLGQQNIGQQNAFSNYATNIGNVDATEAARRQDLASSLRGLG